MGREDDEYPDTTSSLLVRNLNFRTSQNDLRELFSEIGKVRDVYMPLDYLTRQPRGFAFVEYYSHDDATKAVEELNGTSLDGRDIAVVVAQQRRKKPDEMRDRDGNKDPRGRPPGWRGGDNRRGGGYRRGHSPSPYRGRSYSPRRRYSRDRGSRHRRNSPSPDSRHRSYSRSRSPPPRRSPNGSLSPRRDRGKSPSRSPHHQRPRSDRRSKSPSRSYSRSRSRGRGDYGKKKNYSGRDGGRSRSSG